MHFVQHAYKKASAGKSIQIFLSLGGPILNSPYSSFISFLALHLVDKKQCHMNKISKVVLPSLTLSSENFLSFLPSVVARIMYVRFSSPAKEKWQIIPSIPSCSMVPFFLTKPFSFFQSLFSTVHCQKQLITSRATGVSFLPDSIAVYSSLILPGDLTYHFCDCSFASKPHLIVALSMWKSVVRRGTTIQWALEIWKMEIG